jgi:hypothetical protein
MPKTFDTGSKTSRFLSLVVDRHGPLADLPVREVSPICARVARSG